MQCDFDWNGFGSTAVLHRAYMILSRILRRLPLLALVVCAACTGKWVSPQAAKVSTIAAWVDTPKTPYKIEPGDDVSVVMPFNPELNYEAVVDPKGGLTLPLIGTIQAGGQTVDQAGRDINHMLAVKGITEDAYASVSIRTYAGRIYVGGQVKKPGPVPMQSDMDVLQAITAAGGMMDTARSGQVVVIRRSPDGRPMLRSVNLTALIRKADPQQSVALQPSDTIFVPEATAVEADQWVDRYITRLVPFNQSINYNVGSGGFFR